jgi:hypothetical protein
VPVAHPATVAERASVSTPVSRGPPGGSTERIASALCCDRIFASRLFFGMPGVLQKLSPSGFFAGT